MELAHIISEIQRIAAVHGGKPPGKRKFRSTTGIKEYSWIKYWVVWGDALQEAGFSPNERQEAYPKVFLLECYARFAQELGRLPGENHLRHRYLNDASFPSPSTFDKRFGSKAELVGELLAYCEANEGIDDVRAMCEKYRPRRRPEPSETSFEKTQDGFVYLIKSGRFYKIGRSNAPGRREYELSIQLPDQPATVHTIRTDDPIGIEAYWHKRFEDKRKGGEWFALNARDVAAFKQRKLM
jgi:hypothetical protein